MREAGKDMLRDLRELRQKTSVPTWFTQLQARGGRFHQQMCYGTCLWPCNVDRLEDMVTLAAGGDH